MYPLYDSVSLQSFILGVNHPFIAPATCKAYPIALYCTTIAQHTPPHRPLLCMPHTLKSQVASTRDAKSGTRSLNGTT